MLNACQVYFVECGSKSKSILKIICYEIYMTVYFQLSQLLLWWLQEYVAGLVINYGISNTIVLEIP